MTAPDFQWRGLGLVTLAVAGALGPGGLAGTNAAVGPLAFVAAMIGLVLLVQGRRVPAALRVERSRHPNLPQAIRRRTTGRNH